MFLPLKDKLPSLRTPTVTLVLIAINIAVYLVGLTPAQQQVTGSTLQVAKSDLWISEYGAVPCEVLGRCGNQPGAVVVDGGFLDPTPRTVRAEVDEHPPALTVLTSMFLHGGFLHLAFNVLFLWVFGNNVEDAMHPLSFLGFYLAGGMIATFAQALVSPNAAVPVVGASGAIAAVIGAYLLLYPRARVLTIVFFPIVLWVPAWFVAGGWGAVQFFATWKSIFEPTALDGGVAYMAHAAGFAFGIAAISMLAERRNPRYAELYGGSDQDETAA